jgi:hypothetical protein
MIRPLAPVRPVSARPGAVDVNVTLTMNDGTVCRPRLSDGRLIVVGETKPVRSLTGAELRAGPQAALRVLDEVSPWPRPKASAPPRPAPKGEPAAELW